MSRTLTKNIQSDTQKSGVKLTPPYVFYTNKSSTAPKQVFKKLDITTHSIAEESRTHKPLGAIFLQLLPRRGLQGITLLHRVTTKSAKTLSAERCFAA